MLIALIALVLAVLVPAVGGRFSNVARLRLHGIWLVLFALAVQVLITSVLETESVTLSKGLHLATYGAITIFILVNRRVPFMWVVGLGASANFLVIAANGGVMPASRSALEASGQSIDEGFRNSAPVDNAHLRFLGDNFSTPKWLPFANVFSVGDVLLLVGLVLVFTAVSRIPTDAVAPYLRPNDDDDCITAHVPPGVDERDVQR